MKTIEWASYGALALIVALAMTGCGSGDDDVAVLEVDEPGGADLARLVDSDRVVSAEQIRDWVAEKAQFDQAFMPVGSQAQADYLTLVAGQLRDTCLTDVARESFTYTNWIPPSTQSLSFTVDGTVQTVDTTGFILRSGVTPVTGIEGEVVVLEGLSARATTILLDGQPIGEAIAARDLEGKIVVAQLPQPFLPIDLLAEQFYLINDPNNDIPSIYTTAYFPALLAIKPIEAALAAQGAAGFVAIQPLSREIANDMYAPIREAIGTVPGVYVDQATGSALVSAIANASNGVTARLTLDATIDATAEADNLTALLPGRPGADTIILSTHTDGTNSNEDNGPAAMLALVDYFCQQPQDTRPASLRLLLSGGHFVGDAGLKSYIERHEDRIRSETLAAIEIEHLGALEWAPVSNGGAYTLTGKPELGVFVLSSDDAAIVEPTLNFARDFERTVVAPQQLLQFGAGLEWSTVTPLISYLSGANYLLSYDVPNMAVTTQFQDFDLMRRQVTAFAQLILDVANGEQSSADEGDRGLEADSRN